MNFLTRFHQTLPLAFQSPLLLVAAVLVLCQASESPSAELDQVSKQRYAKLRETERYQFDIANRYYAKRDWNVAMAEYEKFLRLYERCDLASFVQLRWSHCLVEQKKLNTAIRDGYQAVIDYWPDSPEAVAAQYYIGWTYQRMGDIRKAKKAYAQLISDQPKHFASLLARDKLKDLAKQDEDTDRWLAFVQELAFEVEPDGRSGKCYQAARELASYQFYQGEFARGQQAIERSLQIYQHPEQLAYRIYEMIRSPIRHLTNVPKTTKQGLQLADKAISLIDQAKPLDPEKKKTAKEMTFWIAELHRCAQRDRRELELYEQMLQEFGTADDILSRIAGWFKDHKQRDQARRTYARFEDEIEGQRQIAWMWREEGQHPKAIAIYRELVTTDADRLQEYQYAIGDCLRESNKLTEAITQYQAIDDFPNKLWRVSDCQWTQKNFPEVRNLCSQIMTAGRSPSESAKALYTIGRAYEEEGKTKPAIETFQKVCKLFPQTSEASTAHSRLQDKYKITITLGGVAEKD